VSVRSTLGAGATFTLRLPVHVAPAIAAEWEAAMAARRQQAAADAACVAAATDAPSSPSWVACAGSAAAASAAATGAAPVVGDKRSRSPARLLSSTPPPLLPAAAAAAAGGSGGAGAAAALPLRCLLAVRLASHAHVASLQLQLRACVQLCHLMHPHHFLAPAQDDHALNLKLVKRLLEQHGFRVETAANGKEAFDRLVRVYETGAPPHIAIIDMQARSRVRACVRACMRACAAADTCKHDVAACTTDAGHVGP
jgi:CheY-like chemotaxis protein